MAWKPGVGLGGPRANQLDMVRGGGERTEAAQQLEDLLRAGAPRRRRWHQRGARVRMDQPSRSSVTSFGCVFTLGLVALFAFVAGLAIGQEWCWNVSTPPSESDTLVRALPSPV